MPTSYKQILLGIVNIARIGKRRQKGSDDKLNLNIYSLNNINDKNEKIIKNKCVI